MRDGILRHTGRRAAGDARGADRAGGRPHRLHQPRHRRRPARRGARASSDLPQAEIELLGRTGSRAHRDAGADLLRALRARPATSCRARRWAGRCCGCASSCSSASTSAPTRSARSRAIERMLRALFAHYAENPPPRRSTGDARPGARDRLAGRDDRPLRRPRVRRPVRAAGVLSRGAVHARTRSSGVRDAVDMVGARGREDRPAPRGHEAARACARSTTSARRRSRSNAEREALPLLRLPGEGRRDRLRAGDRGARLPRGGRVAGRPLRRRARARGRGSARPRRAGAARERLLALLERATGFYAAYLWEAAEAAAARDVPCRARAARGDVLREFRRRATRPSAWDRVLAGGPARRLHRGGARWRRASRSAAAGRRPVRPLPRADHVPARRRAAGACSASAPARCGRGAARST